MGKLLGVEDKYQDISFRYLFIEEKKYDKVMFFFHGFSGNRYSIEIDWINKITEKGYLLIILDAFNHGDRISSEYQKLNNSNKQKLIIDTEIRTAEDAVKVYDYLLEKSVISSDMQVTSMGVSMGAAVAFYFTTIFNNAKTLISLIGSPSFVEFYKYKQEVYRFENNEEFEERLKRYSKIDPLINYHLLEGKKILMTGGLKDRIVPLDYAKALSKKIDSTFIEYNLEHEVNKEMMEDVYDFIDLHLS